MRFSATACACQLGTNVRVAYLSAVEQRVAVAEEEYGPQNDREYGKSAPDGNGDLLTMVGSLLFTRNGWRCFGANGLPEGDRAGTTQVVVGGPFLNAERLGREERLVVDYGVMAAPVSLAS